MVQIDKSTFLGISSNQELANYLEIPIAQLTFFAYSGKPFYSTFSIPKRSDGTDRTISAPAPKLKAIQRTLANTFMQIYCEHAPGSVHGFTNKKSTATNAATHVKKRSIVRIDLRNFFPSISYKRVRGLLQSKPFNFNDKVAETLTKLMCHKGCLPQGAPTSPVISNMICYRMDRDFEQYARQNKLKYTRYADDLTFSSTSKRAIAAVLDFSDENSASINPKVLEIISNNGFEVNEKKTGLFGKGTRQVVTGIVVNKKCNFRREDYRYLRNMFHYWRHNGAEAAARRYVSSPKCQHYQSRFFDEKSHFCERAFIDHIHGLLSYYLMIVKENKQPSKPLQKLWASLHDIANVAVPEMPPERMVFQTDTMTRFRRHGESDWNDYGCTGTCFLVKNQIISARHCAKSQSQSDLQAKYSTDSTFNICGHDIDIDLSYEDIKDDGAFDWLVIQKPDTFFSLPGLSVDSDYQVQEGETVIAFGYADGKKQLRKIEAKVADIHDDEIFVDRAFIKGMSGGPVLNARGDVIGLITYGSGDGQYDKDGRFMPIKIVPYSK